MKSDQHCQILADAVAEILRRGLELDDDAQHFIDSTFSNSTVEHLQYIVNDDADEERAPLLDLVFSPDYATRLELEAILETGRFTEEDESIVEDMLCQRIQEVDVCLPKGRGTIRIEMPRYNAGRFISRLKISKQLDTRVKEAIDAHLEEDLRVTAKVDFRIRRARYPEGRIEFLCRFFERMNAGSTGFKDCLDFVLTLLEELREDDPRDMYKVLVDKKRSCFRSIQQAKRFEEQLRKSNMEIMMMQGARMPYVNKDETAWKMKLIDRISIAVFGKTEFIEEPTRTVDYGHMDSTEDMGYVVKLLS